MKTANNNPLHFLLHSRSFSLTLFTICLLEFIFWASPASALSEQHDVHLQGYFEQQKDNLGKGIEPEHPHPAPAKEELNTKSKLEEHIDSQQTVSFRLFINRQIPNSPLKIYSKKRRIPLTMLRTRLTPRLRSSSALSPA